MSVRQSLKGAQRWVIKIGSALLTANGAQLDAASIAVWVRQIAALRERGIEVVLVSSGAVAAGMSRLGWTQRPKRLHELQAAAAVGQMGLVQTYEQEFQKYGLQTAQVLLDHDDLSSRERYLNARSTLLTLMDLGVVAVVNENDTVVTDEIRFGDNDTLGALVANLVEADALLILTDQDGMFDADPRTNPDAKFLHEVAAADPRLAAMAGDGGRLGRGGMITKVKAAKLAARSGAHTVIAGGRLDNVITRACGGENIGTLLVADQPQQQARKRWLAGQLQARGELMLDAGAVQVISQQGKSLLPVGVKLVRGEFVRGDMVRCLTEDGREIARGLVNYSAADAKKIIGKSTEQIEMLLGYKDDDELIHRDNLALL